ncbi:hypothetical protein FRC00_005640, partial [Tulasnella sp. 408]
PLPPSPAFDPTFPPPPPRPGYPPAWSGPPASPSVQHTAYERDRATPRLNPPLGPPPEPLSRRPHGRTSSGSFPIDTGFPVAPPTAPRADRREGLSDYDRRDRERERDFIREIKREELDEPGEWKSVVPSVSKHSTGSSVVYGGERGVLPPLAPASRPYSRNGYVPSPRTSTPSSYTQEAPPARYQLPPLGPQSSQDRLETGQRLRDNEPTSYASPSRQSSFSRPPPSSHSLTPDAPPEFHYREPGVGHSPSRMTTSSAPSHDASNVPRTSQDRDQHREEAMRPPSVVDGGEVIRHHSMTDAMEVDTSASVPTPRMDPRPENGLGPDTRRDLATPVLMDTREDDVRPPSERAATPEEPPRRASGEEEEEEAPRRTRPIRRAGRKHKGRQARRAAEDMDVDDDPARQYLGAGLPSAQDSEAITQYLRSNKRLESDTEMDLVEDVLAQNHHLVDTLSSRQPTTADQLVHEIARSAQTEALIQDYCDGTRDVIVAQVKRGYDDVSAKVRQLRNQYLTLNRDWEVRCADLDREKQLISEKQALKTPVPTTPSVDTPSFSANSFFTSGRTTRRTTGGLGNLMADAVRSDLEFEQVMASLGNEDLVDPNILSIRNAATIPDMLSVQPRARPLLDVVYDDTNGVVEYPEQFYDVSSSLGDWTEEEKEIFMEQFAVNGKQFGKIADHLRYKTAEQCVLFYYISKKSLVDYGEVLNSKKYARGRRKVLARRNIAANLGKQKGNALLTDIRTTAGEATPADSPNGSPKNTDIELGGPVAPRRRGRPPANGLGERTRPVRGAARGRRGASPDSDMETPANVASGEEGSSSENDGEAPSATEGGRRTNKPRRAAAERRDVPTPTPSTPAEKKKESKKGRPSSHWSALERKVYLEQLALYGKSWYHIAQEVKTKTPAQCRNFYKANEKDMGLDKIVEAWEAQNRESESEPERGDKASPSASSSAPEEPASKVSGIEALRNIQNANAAHSKPADTHPSNGIHSLPRRPDSASGQTGKDGATQSGVFPYTISQPRNTTFVQQITPYVNGAGSGSWAQRPSSGPQPTYAQPATFLPTPSSNVYASATSANRIPSGGNLATPPLVPNAAGSNGHSLPQKPSFSTLDNSQSAQGNQSRPSTSSGTPQRPANGSTANGASASSTAPPAPGTSLPPKPGTYLGNSSGPMQFHPSFQDSPYGSKQAGSAAPSAQLSALPPFGSKPNPVTMARATGSQVDAANSMDGLD